MNVRNLIDIYFAALTFFRCLQMADSSDPSKPNQFEDEIESIVSIFERTADMFANVKDAESAKHAVPTFEEINRDLAQLWEKLNWMKETDYSEFVNAAENPELKSRMNEATQRFQRSAQNVGHLVRANPALKREMAKFNRVLELVFIRMDYIVNHELDHLN